MLTTVSEPKPPLVERLFRGCCHRNTTFRRHHRPMPTFRQRRVFAVGMIVHLRLGDGAEWRIARLDLTVGPNAPVTLRVRG